MTETGSTSRSIKFRSASMPKGRPALPDCHTVLEWDADGVPSLRWETLHERDARLHAAWYVERMRTMGYRAYAPKKGAR